MSPFIDPKTGLPPNPHAAARSAVEKAFADAVEAKAAAMMSSSAAIIDPTTAATNSLIHLRDARAGWLEAIDTLFPT